MASVCVLLFLLMLPLSEERNYIGTSRKEKINWFKYVTSEVYESPTAKRKKEFPYEYEPFHHWTGNAYKDEKMSAGITNRINGYLERDESHAAPQDVSIRDRPQHLYSAEIDYANILATLFVKLVASTVLTTWFLAAGTILYGLAVLTGTTQVFGQDSVIGYIYKTLPFVEAILRGESNFSR
ncbi:uncharacterized protein LOC119568065 [Penaeus monodon]|uniref:uncharacterized protein LOC119568065 n=1 Tax=Penaeus monodon TaxID=6687 RepID=UPI0018A722D2|nr:uncharacterized protein LOC119568065 [Penaeus monodon]